MLPRLAPRRCRRRRSSTLFPPLAPIPPTSHQRQPQSRIPQDHDNDADSSDCLSMNDLGMDLLVNAAANHSKCLSSLPSSGSQSTLSCPSGTAPWSPPRSTSMREDRASGNNKAPDLEKSEDCTTPTNNSQLYLDCPQQYLSSSIVTLTPPATAPAPLLVSAKRLGTEVRSLHSKRRRASWRSFLDNSSQTESKNSEEDEQPMAFADELNPHCSRKGPIRRFDRWKNQKEGQNEAYNGLLSSPLGDDDDDDEPYPLLPTMLQTLSPQEQKRRYWQLCYGSDPPIVAPTPPSTSASSIVENVSWSASRKPPARSCLSSAKKASRTDMSMTNPNQGHGQCCTPKASSVEAAAASTTSQEIKTKSVQFGSPKAAYYEVDAPSIAMTPIPSEEARKIFPVDDPQEHPRNQEEHELELQMIKETKLNTQVLQEWEMTFDDFNEESYGYDEEDEGDHTENERKEGHLPSLDYVLPTIDDDYEELDTRSRQKRRSSGFFSQSDVSAALLSSSDSDDEENKDEYEDKKIAAAEPCDDDSIACHIAMLSMTTNMTIASSTPSQATFDQCSGIQSIIIPDATPSSHSDSSSMETTPPSDTSSNSTGMTPPSDLSYSSVHSSGAAFIKSNASPDTDSRKLPESRALKFGVDNDEKDSDMDETTKDILELLRNSPDADREEWDTSAMLRTIARHSHSTNFETADDDDEVRSFLAFASVSSGCKSLVRTVVDAFFYSVDSHLSTKTSTDRTTATSRFDVAEATILTLSEDCEWMKLEAAFWQHLNDGLEELGDELSALSTGVSCTGPAIELQPNLRRLSLWHLKKELESSVLQLEAAISDEYRSQCLIKAELSRLETRCNLESAMPFSVLTFRVTAALISFQMVGYTGSLAVWRMDHVVDGVASEVTWNKETGKLYGMLVTSEDDPWPDKVPRDHVASQLHEILAVRCIEESHHFLQCDNGSHNQISEDILPDCLAHLAVSLGRIDLIVQSLWSVVVNQQPEISLLSSVSGNNQATLLTLDVDDGNGQKRTLRITFDSAALPLPSKVEVAMIKVGSSDYPVSGWNTLEDWRSTSPWATGALFQDICAAAAS